MHEYHTRLAALCRAEAALGAAVAAMEIIHDRQLAHGSSVGAEESAATLACERVLLRYLRAEIAVMAVERAAARDATRPGGDV